MAVTPEPEKVEMCHLLVSMSLHLKATEWRHRCSSQTTEISNMAAEKPETVKIALSNNPYYSQDTRTGHVVGPTINHSCKSDFNQM